jgi:hypothetical protein
MSMGFSISIVAYKPNNNYRSSGCLEKGKAGQSLLCNFLKRAVPDERTALSEKSMPGQ